MTDSTESAGTMGGGTAWSHPLPTEAPDGTRIVYVAVPNEDTIRMAQEHAERQAEQAPRINALTTVIGLRSFKDTSIEDILRDAKKVERFIRTGKVKKGGQEA